MVPFAYAEACTAAAYGLRGFDAWRVLDLTTYVLQVGACWVDLQPVDRQGRGVGSGGGLRRRRAGAAAGSWHAALRILRHHAPPSTSSLFLSCARVPPCRQLQQRCTWAACWRRATCCPSPRPCSACCCSSACRWVEGACRGGGCRGPPQQRRGCCVKAAHVAVLALAVSACGSPSPALPVVLPISSCLSLCQPPPADRSADVLTCVPRHPLGDSGRLAGSDARCEFACVHGTPPAKPLPAGKSQPASFAFPYNLQPTTPPLPPPPTTTTPLLSAPCPSQLRWYLASFALGMLGFAAAFVVLLSPDAAAGDGREVGSLCLDSTGASLPFLHCRLHVPAPPLHS